MPVPSSYNDIYEGREIRDHVGSVVYERTFAYAPIREEQVAILRFDSVTTMGTCASMRLHLGGHKGFPPFEFDVTDTLDPREEPTDGGGGQHPRPYDPAGGDG